MTAIYKKELRSYFCNMTGAIFIAFLLLITGIMSVMYNFKGLYPNFEYSLSDTGFIFLLIVPILTMRIVAEEKHSRTDQLLYSLPLKVTDVVLGKYLAIVTVFLIPVGVMCLYPVILSSYGKVAFCSAYGSILGFFLMGCALLAIGMFISSLTESQVIAAVLSFGVLLVLYLMSALSSLIPSTSSASLVAFSLVCLIVGLIVWGMTKDTVAGITAFVLLEAVTVIFYITKKDGFAGLFPNVLGKLSVFDRFNSFINGVFDLTAVVFYLSIVAFCVFLTVQSVEKKRWS